MDADTPSVTGIAKVVLRVDDLSAMREFYTRVVGLETDRSLPGIVFLAVAAPESPPRRGGHPQSVVLVDRRRRPWPWRGLEYAPLAPEASSLDHLAFEIRPESYDRERHRLTEVGLDVVVSRFLWDCAEDGSPGGRVTVQ